MTAIDTVRKLMKQERVTLQGLSDYGELGTSSNISQMLNRDDLKVGTFVKMLDALGFELVAKSIDTPQTITVDYGED